MVLNPFWGGKVAGVMVDGGLSGAASRDSGSSVLGQLGRREKFI
jgi:hypothetical protein